MSVPFGIQLRLVDHLSGRDRDDRRPRRCVDVDDVDPPVRGDEGQLDAVG